EHARAEGLPAGAGRNTAAADVEVAGHAQGAEVPDEHRAAEARATAAVRGAAVTAKRAASAGRAGASATAAAIAANAAGGGAAAPPAPPDAPGPALHCAAGRAADTASACTFA